MAARTEVSAVAAGTTAAALFSGNAQRRMAIVHNAGGTNPIYVGPSDVTDTTGLPIPAGEKLVLYWAEGDMSVAEALYVITAAAQAQTSPADTRVLVTYAF